MSAPKRLLLILIDGLDQRFLGRLVEQSFDEQRSMLLPLDLPEFCIGNIAWGSLLTGAFPHEHGLVQAPNDGEQVDQPRLIIPSILSRCDLAGLDVVSVNLPALWTGNSSSVHAIDEAFFRGQDTDAVVGFSTPDLARLRVAPHSLGEAHLAQLSTGLLQLGRDDRRKLAAQALLAHALTVQNVATAVVRAQFDLTVVRYDSLARFFAGFIDYEAPAPYILAEDADLVRPILSSTVALHMEFVKRLRALAGEHVFIMCSDHGWHRELRDAHRPDVPEDYDPAKPELDTRPALQGPPNARDYIAYKPFAVVSPELFAGAMPRPRLGIREPAAAILDWLNVPNSNKQAPSGDGVKEFCKSDEDERGEQFIDDVVELGLLSLPHVDDARRESRLLDQQRVTAASLQSAREWFDAAAEWERSLKRCFDFADFIRYLQCRVLLEEWSAVYELARKYRNLAPFSVPLAHAFLLAAHHLKKPDEVSDGFAQLAAIENTGETARQLANSLKLTVGLPYRWELMQPAAKVELAVSRGLDWWQALDRELAGSADRFSAAGKQLENHDLSPVQSYLKANSERDRSLLSGTHDTAKAFTSPEELNRRMRARGLSSVQRHADPTQAAGLAQARRGSSPLISMFASSILQEARSIHETIFAAYPEIGGVVREHSHGVRIASKWLDGSEAPGSMLIENGVETRMHELDLGLQRLTDRVHPALVSAAICYDFTLIHPFVDGNGRTSRLLAERMLQRSGSGKVSLLNLERRLDRRRALLMTVVGLSQRMNEPAEFVRNWVRFLADSAEDCAERAARVLRYVS